MKKIFLPLIGLSLLAAPAVQAKNLSGIKIYVNPGHGGYNNGAEKNDRNVPTIPFEPLDQNGFWESKSNLVKGLELERLLKASGANVMISRTQNRDEDDKDLSEISEEANVFGANAFISVHSNALGTNNGTNYLLCMYKGIEGGASGDAAKPEDKEMARRAWAYLFDNNLTVWTSGFSVDNPCIRDDFHFLGYYLGVMRNLTVPGFLIEGSFHDYEPETHRLLNNDYCKLTAVDMQRFFCDYFGAEKTGKGVIAGSVKDSQRVVTNEPRFNNYIKKSHDQYLPLNGANVTLMDASGKQLATYKTDDFYNGVYVFRDLTPGTYKVRMEAVGYVAQEQTVTVTADKTTSFVTLLEDPNYVPPVKIQGKANIFASELAASKLGGGKYRLDFKLNADATNVTVKVMNGSSVAKTFDLGAKKKGANRAVIDMSGVAGTEFGWVVVAGAEPTTAEQPLKYSDSDEAATQFKQARGIAVDNNMSSPYFGRVYVSEALGGAIEGGRTTNDGIYVLDAMFTDVTGQGNNAYTGGENWTTDGGSGPMRLFVAEDSKVYMTDWSDTHSGIWTMDPANPSATFKSVFAAGTRNAAGVVSVGGVDVHGSISSCYVEGNGANTVLYTFDEDYVGANVDNKMTILRYNIGTLANPWGAAPSEVVFPNTAQLQQNGNSVILPDGKGGWWISQYRFSDSAAIPSLIHANASGTVDYNSGTTGVVGTSQRAGMAINSDGTLMAMGCADEVKIFDIAYGDGAPTLTQRYSIAPALGSDAYALAFDLADNIYLATGVGGGIGAWALPKTENKFETTAPASMNLSDKLPEASVDAVDATQFHATFKGGRLVVESSDELVSVAVYNMSGVAVCQVSADGNKVEVDAEDWQNGIYVVKANNQVVKVIKR